MVLMNGASRQLETAIEIITPENIAFRYHVAGPFLRLPAYLIDFAIRAAAMLLGFVVLQLLPIPRELGAFALTGYLLMAFVLNWFYGGLFEAYWNGQTPGKRLMGIRVLTVDGQPINAFQAILRNILREIDAQPILFYQVGLWAATNNDRFQRLGDLAAGTIVVIEQRRWLRGVLRVQEPRAVQLAARIPPSFQASRLLARALASYVERRHTFSWGRRLEIARHLGEPLRRQFDLPADTDLDLLLCALYQRTFVGQAEEPAAQTSPFMEPESPLAFLEEVR